jgi:hypothetical protein
MFFGICCGIVPCTYRMSGEAGSKQEVSKQILDEATFSV